MRTSGRGRSEILLFVAPAAIFGGLYIWIYGSPLEAVTALDHVLLKGLRWASAVVGTVVQAITG